LKTRHKIYIARQLTKIWFFRLRIKDIVVQEKKLLFEETGNQQETDNIEQDKPEEEMFASLLTEVTNNDYKRGIDLIIEVPENFIYETPEIA
jgi:hypothetical protein